MARDDPSAHAPMERALWRHTRDLAIDADRDGRVHEASPAARSWLGGNEALLDLVHPHDATRLVTLLTGEPPTNTEFRFAAVPPQHGWRVLEVTASTPTARGTVFVGRDVTRERQALATLDAHRDVLRMIAAAEPLPAVFDALARSIEAVSAGARVVVLFARDDDLELAAAPSLRADASAAFARLRAAATPETFPAAGALSGRVAEVAAEHGLGFGWVAPVHDGDDALAVLVLLPGAKRFPSADEQAALEAGVPLAHVAIAAQRLRADRERTARNDALTGVLGRQAFVAELGHLARRSRDALGVLLVQVDGLAELNAHAGSVAGDSLLQVVATRLASAVRGRDLVGRCSGARFVVASSALGPSATLAELAARVEPVLGEPVTIGGAPVDVRVRLASATHRGRLSDPEALLVEAEAALRSGQLLRNARPADGRRRDRRSGAAHTDR
jgi:diguanylate cyclase (GGDEF)-like protein